MVGGCVKFFMGRMCGPCDYHQEPCKSATTEAFHFPCTLALFSHHFTQLFVLSLEYSMRRRERERDRKGYLWSTQESCEYGGTVNGFVRIPLVWNPLRVCIHCENLFSSSVLSHLLFLLFSLSFLLSVSLSLSLPSLELH